MKKEKSCGIIVFKEENNEIYTLMVKHNKGHWGAPKGHVEINETEEETAIREVYEETGIKANIIDGFREIITYSPKENTIKDVVFFIGEPETENIKVQIEEVEKVSWININEVNNYIEQDDAKELTNKAITYYKGCRNK